MVVGTRVVCEFRADDFSNVFRDISMTDILPLYPSRLSARFLIITIIPEHVFDEAVEREVEPS